MWECGLWNEYLVVLCSCNLLNVDTTTIQDKERLRMSSFLFLLIYVIFLPAFYGGWVLGCSVKVYLNLGANILEFDRL